MDHKPDISMIRVLSERFQQHWFPKHVHVIPISSQPLRFIKRKIRKPPPPYMNASQREHDQSELLPHLEPVVEPIGEAAVLRPAPQLNVGGYQAWGMVKG